MMSSISTENLTPAFGSSLGLTDDGATDDEVVPRKPPIIETILSELGFGWFQVRMIFILGVAHATDTMETIIQTILGPSLRCDWHLSADYITLLTSLVFLGSCIGAVPLGYAADVYGRRSICLLSCLTLMYLSWLCAISPTYAWISSLRFLSGLFIGGVLTAGSSLLSETMPSKFQAAGQLITNNFEAFVGVITAAIGLGCMEGGLSWRYFLLFTTAPLALCAVALFFFAVESPVYLYSKKQTLEAAHVLDKVAIANRLISQTLNNEISYLGRIQEADETEDFRVSKVGAKEVYTLLIRKRPWLLPLLLCLNFSWGFLIYGGTTILPVELAAGPRICLRETGSANETGLAESVGTPGGTAFECCKPLRKEGYQSLLISASGGLLNLPLAYSLVALLGQRLPIAQLITFLLTGILLFCQAFCIPPSASNIVFFVTRGVAAAGNGLIGIYASNIFQSRVRSLSSGLCAAAYRLGILTAPYVGQVLLQNRSDLLAILTFSLVAVAGAVASLLLPQIRVLHKAPPPSTSTANLHDSKRSLPPRTATGLPKSSKKMSTNNSVAILPTSPPKNTEIALIETTYREIRQREKATQGTADSLVHKDFVPRNAAFEVDA